MEYGLTSTGFILKRLADIKAVIEGSLEDSFGEINVAPDSVFGQFIGAFSKELAEVWEKMEGVYYSPYPASADGAALDNAVATVGVARLLATPSAVVVQQRGTASTSVPAGTQFSQGSTGLVLETDAISTIVASAVHVTKITVDTAATTTVFTVTIDGNAITYTTLDPTTLETIAAGLAAAVNAELLVNTKVSASHSTGDDFLEINILAYDVSNTFSVAVGANLTITDIWSPVACTAVDSGANPFPVGGINTIITPVAGLTEVYNFADGIIGNEIETDTELRIRRKTSLDVISSSTVEAIRSRLEQDLTDVGAAFVFENRGDVWDGSGIATTTFDADLVASNTVSYSLNSESITPVAFATDHDTTMEALRATIELLPGVVAATLTDTAGTNRIIEVAVDTVGNESKLFITDAPIISVLGGASQAGEISLLSNTGMPPHSFEAIVAALDTPEIRQLVVDKLWEIKPAGIQAHGAAQGTVVDSNGDNQYLGFTFSVTKYIYVEVSYDKTNSDNAFPLDGEDQISEAILAYGGGLTFGSDILIQPLEAKGYAAGGITNVTVRIAAMDNLVDSAVWLTVNKKIAISELPAFDSSRITLIDVTP